MNKEQIMGILPHRDNMLLIDEAEVIDGVAHGRKRIQGDEWFLKGHFPGNPVVPGVILCEIMAQSACSPRGRPRGRPPSFPVSTRCASKIPCARATCLKPSAW